GAALKHPGAAPVESIEMRELRIGAVGDHGRRQPRRPAGRCGAGRQARKKSRQPVGERARSERATHEVRLRQARREEILARGLVGERSEEHTSELQSQSNLVCRLLLEKKKMTEAA